MSNNKSTNLTARIRRKRQSVLAKEKNKQQKQAAKKGLNPTRAMGLAIIRRTIASAR